MRVEARGHPEECEVVLDVVDTHGFLGIFRERYVANIPLEILEQLADEDRKAYL